VKLEVSETSSYSGYPLKVPDRPLLLFPSGPEIAELPAMIERLFASATMYATLAMFFDFRGCLHAG